MGFALLLMSLVIWNGADKQASDATQPLAMGPAQYPYSTPPQTLKIGSFNIHGGKGQDGVRNLPRIADLLTDRDFVGLYEVRAQSDGRHANQAAALAGLRETAWLFAPTERQWWTDHFGNGLLHRLPLTSVLRIPLVNSRGKAYRNAVLATVPLEKADVRVLLVHVDREADRRSQLQTMIALFLDLKEPCVLMGDLNTTADDPLLVRLCEIQGVHSPLQESPDRSLHSQNIDWIFTRGLRTISVALVENLASDHPYLKAELAPME